MVVHVANQKIVPKIRGLVVVDVVEGAASDAGNKQPIATSNVAVRARNDVYHTRHGHRGDHGLRHDALHPQSPASLRNDRGRRSLEVRDEGVLPYPLLSAQLLMRCSCLTCVCPRPV